MANLKPARAHLPAIVVSVAPGRFRVDGRDAKRNTRRFFTGPQAEAQAKKFAADLNAAPRSSIPSTKFTPAQVVQVSPGRFRVDGHDAKRNYRRFFTNPNAERDAKAHAAQLNAARQANTAAPGKGPSLEAATVDQAIASDFAAINTACDVLSRPTSNPEELKGARTSIQNAMANLKGHARGPAAASPVVAALSPAVQQALIKALTAIFSQGLPPVLIAALERAIAMGAFNQPKAT